MGSDRIIVSEERATALYYDLVHRANDEAKSLLRVGDDGTDDVKAVVSLLNQVVDDYWWGADIKEAIEKALNGDPSDWGCGDPRCDWDETKALYEAAIEGLTERYSTR